MYVLWHEEFIESYEGSDWRYIDIFYHDSKEFLEKLIEEVKAYHKFKSKQKFHKDLHKESTYFSDTVIKLWEKYQTNLTISELKSFDGWTTENILKKEV